MRCINPLMVGSAARYRAITADDVAAAMIRFALDSPALNGHHIVERAKVLFLNHNALRNPCLFKCDW